MSNDLGKLADLAKPKIPPVLDEGFRPAVLANKAFRKLVQESGNPVPLVIGLERADGTTSRFETAVLPASHPDVGMNYPYVERLVKFLLLDEGRLEGLHRRPEGDRRVHHAGLLTDRRAGVRLQLPRAVGQRDATSPS